MTDVKPPLTPPATRQADEATRDALEPGGSYAPRSGLIARIERSNVWRSMFRHPTLDTPRGRALQSFSNFFLHLYPVKIPARVLRIRYSFRLGFIITVLFGILVLTGVYLMFFYTPTVGSAYGDMQQLRTGVGFGQLVRNVHRWSAHLMVLAVFLHLARTFYAGAYKKPREFNWVIGVVLLLLTLGLSFTGYLLPWDQLSYWAVTVGTNLVHYVPLIGGTHAEPADRRRTGRPEHAAALLRAPRRGAAGARRPHDLHPHLAGAQGRLRRRALRPSPRPTGTFEEEATAPPSPAVLPGAPTTLYGGRTRVLGVVDRQSVTAEERAVDDTRLHVAAPARSPRRRRARRRGHRARARRRVRRSAARPRQPQPDTRTGQGAVVLRRAAGAARRTSTRSWPGSSCRSARS